MQAKAFGFVNNQNGAEMSEDETVQSSGIHVPRIPLGILIAERLFDLYDTSGERRQVVVKLGQPVLIPDLGLHRCPAQILGLDIDEMVYSPAGGDTFEALYNALDLVGQLLDQMSQQLQLENREKRREVRSLEWIWKYPS